MKPPMSRVLMVDDAGLFRMLEASFLRRLGCEIVRASDASDLMKKASDSAPHLILLDAQKPGLDGPGCVRALKADPGLRAIPILVVTDAGALDACCAAGADAALSRPLDRGALELALSSLARVAQRKGKRRPARGWVRVGTSGGTRRGRLKDISRTGLFLALPEPLPLDSRVALSLRLSGPGGDRRVRAEGVVVRQVPRDPESHLIPGVGVRFVEIGPDDEKQIDHYVNEAALEAPSDDEAGGGAERL